MAAGTATSPAWGTRKENTIPKAFPTSSYPLTIQLLGQGCGSPGPVPSRNVHCRRPVVVVPFREACYSTDDDPIQRECNRLAAVPADPHCLLLEGSAMPAPCVPGCMSLYGGEDACGVPPGSSLCLGLFGLGGLQGVGRNRGTIPQGMGVVRRLSRSEFRLKTGACIGRSVMLATLKNRPAFTIVVSRCSGMGDRKETSSRRSCRP